MIKDVQFQFHHASWEYELELDENGWVNIEQQMDALRDESDWKELEVNDLQKMIYLSDKKRHEISDGKIRALYGHSTPNKIKLEEKEPQEILYHGTAKRFVDKIKSNGLLPMNRQYVHLFADIETARIVGKRRDSEPVVLKIYSGEAFADGVKFYHGNENIWLADKIDSKYIEF